MGEAIARDDVAQWVWAAKYRLGAEASIEACFERVARALAGGTGPDARRHASAWFELMRAWRFLPGGRILANAGAGAQGTLFNCFVLPPVRVGAEGLAAALQEAEATLRLGGGVGVDLSLLEGGEVLPALGRFDRMAAGIAARGQRGGAMMATLACDHPAIADFVRAKEQAGALPHFNLSLQLTDAFMADVRGAGRQDTAARRIWRLLLRQACASAEPGVLFVDRINRANNLWYCERLSATNPCGEIPLPAYGACALGSINLAAFVKAPFTPRAAVDRAALDKAVGHAVRLLDAAIDASIYPLPAQERAAKATRRLGLGIMGLGDALAMLGQRYDSAKARATAESLMARIAHAAYRASVGLAREKGAFPLFNRDDYLAGEFTGALPAALRDAIARDGIRNSHLLAIAPTGSISLLAGGVSNGIEPVFAPVYAKWSSAGGASREIVVENPAVRLWRARCGDPQSLPPAYVGAPQVAPLDQLRMQAAIQRHVDNAISKTVFLPPDAGPATAEPVFNAAFDLGLKGCTLFRSGTVRGAVHRARQSCFEADQCGAGGR